MVATLAGDKPTKRNGANRAVEAGTLSPQKSIAHALCGNRQVRARISASTSTNGSKTSARQLGAWSAINGCRQWQQGVRVA